MVHTVLYNCSQFVRRRKRRKKRRWRSRHLVPLQFTGTASLFHYPLEQVGQVCHQRLCSTFDLSLLLEAKLEQQPMQETPLYHPQGPPRVRVRCTNAPKLDQNFHDRRVTHASQSEFLHSKQHRAENVWLKIFPFWGLCCSLLPPQWLSCGHGSVQTIRRLFACKQRVGDAISVKTLVRRSLGLLCRPCSIVLVLHARPNQPQRE